MSQYNLYRTEFYFSVLTTQCESKAIYNNEKPNECGCDKKQPYLSSSSSSESDSEEEEPVVLLSANFKSPVNYLQVLYDSENLYACARKLKIY